MARRAPAAGRAATPGKTEPSRPPRAHAAGSRAGRNRAGRNRADPARRAAYDVLRAVAERDAYANLLLPSLLAERGLTGRDAAFATELAYGTLRGRGTYDAVLAACSDRDQLDPPVRDVLRLGAHQLLATRVGRHAAVAASVDLARDVCGPRPSGFVNAVLRRVATRDLDAWMTIIAPDRSQDPSGYLAVRHSYPVWIVDAFRDALGEDGAETEDALAVGNVRPEVVLAVMPGPAGPAGPPTLPVPPAPPDLPGLGQAAGSAGRTRWSPYGLRLAGGDPAPLVASGQAAVQDEASQLAALALARVGLTGAASQDRLWLDLCAGPGGKSRLLAGLAAARGARLVASDLRPHRARRVLEALRRAGLIPSADRVGTSGPAGVSGAAGVSTPAGRPDSAGASGAAGASDPAGASGRAEAVVTADGLRVPWRPGTFDRVLADVPCSGLGSLRRRPEARWRKTPAGVQDLAPLQRGLLNAAIDSVRSGGVVAYVTCSPHVTETRDVVIAVADSRDDVTVLDAPAVLAEVPGLRCPGPAAESQDSRPDPRISRFAQFWPHRHGTDAIFLALLRRG
jgi:16S rRNA (cytosine967-C5)-methyltransferase